MNNRYEKLELTKFDEQVKSHQESLSDVKMQMNRVQYDAGGLVRIVRSYDTIYESKCNEVGFSKLCEKVGAPAGWLRSGKRPEDLEKAVIDRLKRDNDTKYLFRLRQAGGETVLRSVLTERYLTYNHADMWNDMRWTFENSGIANLNPMVWKPEVSDRLDAWILFDNVLADPTVGENPKSYDGGGYGGLKPAIHFRNAEDGTGSVKISSGLFRSYCTNGVIFGFKGTEEMRAIHFGERYMMRSAVWTATFNALNKATEGVDLYLKAIKVELAKDLDDVVKKWSTRFSLSADTSELWGKTIKAIQPATLADFAMATSDFAGNLADRSTTTAMEEMVGSILIAGKV